MAILAFGKGPLCGSVEKAQCGYKKLPALARQGGSGLCHLGGCRMQKKVRSAVPQQLKSYLYPPRRPLCTSPYIIMLLMGDDL